jgi:hypothetical protein
MNTVQESILNQIHLLPSKERRDLLERLIVEEEDLLDVEAARRILAETKPDEWIRYDSLRSELGLDK